MVWIEIQLKNYMNGNFPEGYDGYSPPFDSGV